MCKDDLYISILAFATSNYQMRGSFERFVRDLYSDPFIAAVLSNGKYADLGDRETEKRMWERRGLGCLSSMYVDDCIPFIQLRPDWIVQVVADVFCRTSG